MCVGDLDTAGHKIADEGVTFMSQERLEEWRGEGNLQILLLQVYDIGLCDWTLSTSLHYSSRFTFLH